jgi:hypothetical protein
VSEADLWDLVACIYVEDGDFVVKIYDMDTKAKLTKRDSQNLRNVPGQVRKLKGRFLHGGYFDSCRGKLRGRFEESGSPIWSWVSGGTMFTAGISNSIFQHLGPLGPLGGSIHTGTETWFVMAWLSLVPHGRSLVFSP